MRGVENIVGNQHFLLSPTTFSKGFFCGVFKRSDCVAKYETEAAEIRFAPTTDNSERADLECTLFAK